jgi:hypothetical protein
MRRGSGPGWQLSVSDPWDLCFALYVRDALGLVDDRYPPLTPAVPVWDVPGRPEELRGAAARQWREWWARLLGLRLSGPVDSGLGGPDFAETSGAELREAQQTHFRPARRWRREHPWSRRREPGTVPHDAALLETHLVSEIEQALGRRVEPFSFAVEVIPTAGRRYWDLSPTHLIVSEELHGDTDSYRDVLRPRLTRLA